MRVLTIDAVIFFMMQTFRPMSFVSCHLYKNIIARLSTEKMASYQEKIYFHLKNERIRMTAYVRFMDKDF